MKGRGSGNKLPSAQAVVDALKEGLKDLPKAAKARELFVSYVDAIAVDTEKDQHPGQQQKTPQRKLLQEVFRDERFLAVARTAVEPSAHGKRGDTFVISAWRLLLCGVFDLKCIVILINNSNSVAFDGIIKKAFEHVSCVCCQHPATILLEGLYVRLAEGSKIFERVYPSWLQEVWLKKLARALSIPLAKLAVREFVAGRCELAQFPTPEELSEIYLSKEGTSLEQRCACGYLLRWVHNVHERPETIPEDDWETITVRFRPSHCNYSCPCCRIPSCANPDCLMPFQLSLLTCSGCHYVKYCSQQCQHVHWKSHSSTCKAIQQKGIAGAFQDERVSKAIANGRCTITETGKEFVFQRMWQCKTCKFPWGDIACIVCVEKCHAGHELIELPPGACYCDCGAYSKYQCRSLK